MRNLRWDLALAYLAGVASIAGIVFFNWHRFNGR